MYVRFTYRRTTTAVLLIVTVYKDNTLQSKLIQDHQIKI